VILPCKTARDAPSRQDLLYLLLPRPHLSLPPLPSGSHQWTNSRVHPPSPALTSGYSSCWGGRRWRPAPVQPSRGPLHGTMI
jgi:hypothetical protein